MELQIRSETAQDSGEIRAMIKRTLNRPDEARLVDELRSSGNLLYSVVACDLSSGRVVGYAAISPMAGQFDAEPATGARLSPVLVDKDSQGKGLGSLLIKEICKWADQNGLPFIMVTGNPRLYQKFDFGPASRHNLRGTGDMADSFLLRTGPGFVAPAQMTTFRSCETFALLDHATIYPRLIEQFGSLCQATDNLVSRMSTLAALLHNGMPYNSWTGFYLLDKSELVVGPFQGPVACLKLPQDTGVCWRAANTGEPIIVGNVHEFPGHIACDPNSCSEMVVPCRDRNGDIYAVLDIDSHEYNAFDYNDIPGSEQLVAMLKQ